MHTWKKFTLGANVPVSLLYGVTCCQLIVRARIFDLDGPNNQELMIIPNNTCNYRPSGKLPGAFLRFEHLGLGHHELAMISGFTDTPGSLILAQALTWLTMHFHSCGMHIRVR